MQLEELVVKIAGELDNAWQFDVKAGEPVIVSQEAGWLSFGVSPDKLLRIELVNLDVDPYPFLDIEGAVRPRQTAEQIERYILSPYYFKIREKNREDRFRTWLDRCEARYRLFAHECGLRTEFSVVRAGRAPVGLSIEFFPPDRPVCCAVLTLSPDRFAPRLEIRDPEEVRLHGLLNSWAGGFIPHNEIPSMPRRRWWPGRS